MVRITVNFEKRHFWIIAPILVFLAVVGVVVAFNANWQTTPGNTPEIMGHSPDEIFKCPQNKILKTDASGNWKCADEATGGGGGGGMIAVSCPAGQAIRSFTANGVPTCEQVTVTNCIPSATCVASAGGMSWTRTYSTNTECCMGDNSYRCTVCGWITIDDDECRSDLTRC